MGNMQSSDDGLPVVKHSWIFKQKTEGENLQYVHNPSIVRMEYAGVELLACAWQASTDALEGSDNQHIRFCLSRDDGSKWSKSRVVAWGLLPVWSPVLHYDEDSAKLHLFYSESRKVRSPGGDIKVISSSDAGMSWGPPQTIYAQEADGGVPKVVGGKVIVTSDNRWILPFWREPASTYTKYSTYHPLKDNPNYPHALTPPAGAFKETGKCSAGVLISRDGGATWNAYGDIDHPSTWLVNPSVLEVADGKLLMMFRSGVGKVFESYSLDGGHTWTPAFGIDLPNPNSKVDLLRLNKQLLLAYNHSTEKRNPLALAVSGDQGSTWKPVVSIDAGDVGQYTFPCMIMWGKNELRVAYVYYGHGIKMASITFQVIQENQQLARRLSIEKKTSISPQGKLLADG